MFFPAASIQIVITVLLGLCSCAAGDKACYGFSGDSWSTNQNPDLLPCDPSSETSACCSPADICYSNSLCAPGPDSRVSGAATSFFYDGCTDPLRKNESVCLPFCLDTGGNGLQECGSGSYCCYGFGGCDCNNATQVFTLPAGSIVTTLPLTTPTASASTSSSILPATTTTPAASTSAAETTQRKSASSVSVSIGVGVGVGVPVVAGILAGFLIWRRRTTTRQASRVESYEGYKDHSSQYERAEMPASWTADQTDPRYHKASHYDTRATKPGPVEKDTQEHVVYELGAHS